MSFVEVFDGQAPPYDVVLGAQVQSPSPVISDITVMSLSHVTSVYA